MAFYARSCLTAALVVLTSLTCSVADELPRIENKLEAGFSFQDGNVEAFKGNFEGRFTYLDSTWEIAAGGLFAYGEQDGDKNQQNAEGRFSADLWYDDVLSPFVFAGIGFSFQRTIERRWDLGLGVKYSILNSTTQSLSVSIALIRDETIYAAEAGLDDILADPRASIRVKGKHRLSKSGLSFHHVTFYIPSLKLRKNGVSDVRWNSSLSLNFPLSKLISFVVSYEHEFENIVARGKLKNDNWLQLRLRASF